MADTEADSSAQGAGEAKRRETQGASNPLSPAASKDTRAECSAPVVSTTADSSAHGESREAEAREDLRGPTRSKAKFLLDAQQRPEELLSAEWKSPERAPPERSKTTESSGRALAKREEKSRDVQLCKKRGSKSSIPSLPRSIAKAAQVSHPEEPCTMQRKTLGAGVEPRRVSGACGCLPGTAPTETVKCSRIISVK